MRYGVIYRTGGFANYRWHETLFSSYDREDASRMFGTIEAQGYTPLIVDLDKMDHLPTTYYVSTPYFRGILA